MLEFVEKYKGGVHSQNGEANILKECLKRIDIHYNIVCEFGAADGYYCSNTAELNLPRILFEASECKFPVIKATITPENINELVPKNLDILSIDVDGNDYNLWKAYKGIANIVVIEINSSLPPNHISYISDERYGTGYLPMVLLGNSKGYFLLCHVGNLIFVRKEFKSIFPELDGLNPLTDADLFFNKSWLV